MNKLLLVRHGKTNWNQLELIQGSTDIPLNDEGVEGAKQLAEKIKNYKIDVCICSPLTRAKQTAKIIYGKDDIIYDDQIVERSYGKYEGTKITTEVLEKHWDFNHDGYYPEIESMHALFERAKQFLEKIKQAYDGKTILIVTHGAFMKALHFNLVGYDDSTNFLSFFPDNTSVHEYKL